MDKALIEDRGLDAGAIVRELGKYIQGGGGGQKFLQLQEVKLEGIAKALEAAEDIIK